jgi:nucleoside-diphosphate-sugar epimerase
MTGSFKFRQIAQAFEKAVPGSKIRFGPSGEKKPISGATGPSNGIYDISRATRELGYRPAYTIEKIAKEIADYEMGARASR